MPKYMVQANYTVTSTWIIDRDLEEANHWWIKYDCLNIQWPDGTSEEIYPTYPASIVDSDFKRPDDIDYVGEYDDE